MIAGAIARLSFSQPPNAGIVSVREMGWLARIWVDERYRLVLIENNEREDDCRRLCHFSELAGASIGSLNLQKQ
jgi:hypothetical protein